MPAELDEYFRCIGTDEAWEFQVGVVTWEGAHTPNLVWKVFRRWNSPPDASRIQRAKAAALRQSRYFRTCKTCYEVTNAGHMFDAEICQSCAERQLGVVY